MWILITISKLPKIEVGSPFLMPVPNITPRWKDLYESNPDHPILRSMESC